MRHCWLVDRGIVCRALIRALQELKQSVLGRLRCNAIVYFPPAETKTGGRRRIYGEKCRVSELLQQFPERLRRHEMKLRVWGEQRTVEV